MEDTAVWLRRFASLCEEAALVCGGEWPAMEATIGQLLSRLPKAEQEAIAEALHRVAAVGVPPTRETH